MKRDVDTRPKEWAKRKTNSVEKCGVQVNEVDERRKVGRCSYDMKEVGWFE